MEKRQHPRFISGNLLSYVCLDKNENIVKQGMGKTLDVSVGGILLETHVPIAREHTLLLTLGLRDKVVDIKGTVVYSREGEEGRTQSGIKFMALNEHSRLVLAAFIANFKKTPDEPKR